MAIKTIIRGCLLALILTGVVMGDTGFFEEFKDNYGLIDQDLLNYVGEKAHIKDFTYQKDIATFTFTEGDIYFARYINGRPTTAFFEGKGNVTIEIPSHVERKTLEWCSGETSVNEDIETIFIRMADDLDLQLREAFTFEEHKLGWKTYNAYKQSQGEYYFRPVIQHEYDNNFQLLRSVYERKADGYFWTDFNRHLFTFDPNRPEEVIISYEHRGGQLTSPEAVLLQRQETGIYDDFGLSSQGYETTMLSRHGQLEMEGLDGRGIKIAAAHLKFVVNADSLKYVSMFLHYNLKVDSVHYAGQSVPYWRRGMFTFFGLILPEYNHKNDTVDVTVFYHGKDYTKPLPFVKNPAVSEHTFEFTIPKDYTYLMQGKGELVKANGRRQEFTAKPEGRFRAFYFQPFASGFDTISTTSMTGIPVHFMKSAHLRKDRFPCFVPDELYQAAVMDALNFMTGRLGAPPAIDDIFVYPEGDLTMPGLIENEQVYCTEKGTGDLEAHAANQVARQWFGALMQPASDREFWYANAVPDYFSLLAVQTNLSVGTFYSHLLYRRNLILNELEQDGDIPLAAGLRCPATLRTIKGSWLLHMLRFIMFDIEKQSDVQFLKLLREFSQLAMSQSFTNEDFKTLAEKYHGEPLDWFFHHWAFDRNYPEYNVEYRIEKMDDGYYVFADIVTDGVPVGFTMPVWVRIEDANGNSTFHHPKVSGIRDSFKLGPFEVPPTELHFNEFYSVFCKQDVKKL